MAPAVTADTAIGVATARATALQPPSEKDHSTHSIQNQLLDATVEETALPLAIERLATADNHQAANPLHLSGRQWKPSPACSWRG